MKNFKVWALLSVFLLAGPSIADEVTYDFLEASATEGEDGYFADAYEYEVDGVTVRVTGLSSGGDEYAPGDELEAARVAMFWGGYFGLEDGGMVEGVDNLGGDFDFIVFEFDQEVTIDEIGLGYVLGDTDMSIGVYQDGVLVAVDNIYDAQLGSNDVDSGGMSATIWIVGAFHDFFGTAQDDEWDGFKIGDLVVSVNAVPLPAAFWFFATAMLGLGFWRRRVAAPVAQMA